MRYKYKIMETQWVVKEYEVEATSEEEAIDKVWSGETESEKFVEIDSVHEREIITLLSVE